MVDRRDPRGIVASVDQLEAQVESLNTQLGFMFVCVCSLVVILAAIEIRRSRKS